MKKYIIGALIAGILLTTNPVTAGNVKSSLEYIKMKVNGASISGRAVLINGAVYVPLRTVSDSLKMNASYDKTSKTVSISGKSSNNLQTVSTKDPNKIGPEWFKSSGMVELEFKKYRAGFVLDKAGKFYFSSEMLFDAYPQVKDYVNFSELDTKVYKNVVYISFGEVMNILNECGVRWNIAIYHKDAPNPMDY